MFKTKPILATIIMALCSSSAFARIGETGPECVKRYGKPIHVDKATKTMVFQKSGLHIAAIFFGGKVEAIAYQKAENESEYLDLPKKMSDNEISICLKANSPKKFVRKKVISANTEWITEDKSLMAAYQFAERRLMIFTRESAERADKKKKDRERRDLDGL